MVSNETTREMQTFISFYMVGTRRCHSPVVKRSWVSATGLDNDRDGMEVAGRGGGSEVEAGEDRVRTRGWWGQTRAGIVRGSSWRPALRIMCLCCSQGRTAKKKQQWFTWVKLFMLLSRLSLEFNTARLPEHTHSFHLQTRSYSALCCHFIEHFIPNTLCLLG